MTARASPDRPTVLLFTSAAGSVDAIAYMAAHVFTANMTGNAVLMGISIGQGKGRAIINSLVALIVFIGGIVLGAVLAGEGGDKAKTLAAVRREVIVECGVLVLFAATFLLPLPRDHKTVILLLIIFSALAMGLQSAAVKRLHLPGIATTYITGTITSLFTGLVHHFAPRARLALADRSGSVPRFNPSLRLQAEVFLAYSIAALISAFLYVRWPSAVAWLPVVAIGVVAGSLRSRPAGK
ncbi:MAG TPA: YoaK family protein [Candidatus Angelobacter sp.]|nr:YoaK family protein [Candidatus Angelobacter sp.]